MVSASALKDRFNKFIQGSLDFDDYALELFRYQAKHNDTYRSYLELINSVVSHIEAVQDIPCLPISAFKHHKVLSTNDAAEKVFLSSSTTGANQSKHYITSLAHYHKIARQLFEQRFGAIDDKVIMGLLPSYLERSDSSLVSMVNHFIELSSSDLSGFHLYDYDALLDQLDKAKDDQQEVVLFAVRYALLDLAEKYTCDLSHVTIIETGGMKGKRGPVSNEELSSIVKSKLSPKTLVSEYGMTELQSQAYSDDAFVFQMPLTMRMKITDLNDPYSIVEQGRRGQINIVDLANIQSCAFIATDDLGVMLDDNHFVIKGRIDHSEQRGCNLLVSDVIN